MALGLNLILRVISYLLLRFLPQEDCSIYSPPQLRYHHKSLHCVKAIIVDNLELGGKSCLKVSDKPN